MITDAHHHVWRQKDLPWLLGPEQPRIFGAYAPIKRDYSMAEYLDDVAGTGVARSVYVQANWAPNWFLDEVRWVSERAADTGWPHGVVAFADVTQADIRPDLDRLAAFPLVRGIRHQLHWHARPQYRFASRPDLPADPAVQANVAHLADYGWSFDLQVFEAQMGDAAALADACPDVTFVLQHAGMPVDLSDPGLARWRGGLALLAARPNVVAKLSGLGTFLRRNDPAHIASVVADTLAAFGADRCMWGSNFPIEKLWTGFAPLLEAYRAATADLADGARAAVFNDTAERVYRLPNA